MQNIIYKSSGQIPWDTQSAFKITNYYTSCEEHMIFCYLKQYVYQNNLKLCSYCFQEQAQGKNQLQLAINLNPAQSLCYLHFTFGPDGFESILFVDPQTQQTRKIDHGLFSFSVYTANDEQGYYWCFEMDISQQTIDKLFATTLEEKSLITLNLHLPFENSPDYACLFPSNTCDVLDKQEDMGTFVVLNY